jgi:hypothetical protein
MTNVRPGSASLALLGTRQYVKAMSYSAALVHGAPVEFTLGSPALESATAIATATAANSVANTLAALNYTSDSPFGRSVIMTISGNPGNSCVHDLQGLDYLGQPMVERFTGASGATAILYGKKAFWKVTGLKTITPASNAVTYNVGTGRRLGLPYKCDLEYAKEAGVQIPIFKRDQVLEVARPAALAVSGGSVFVRAPTAGFVKDVNGYSYGAGSTNDPVLTVKLATVAITGLTATIDANVSTSASRVVGVPTTAGYNANNRAVQNDLIEIAGTASASAGGDVVGVTFTPTQFSLPDLTDPQTNVTGDPRGTYEPNAVLNGAREIRVALVGDNEVNSSGNGGLHGLQHFFG